MPLCRGIPVLRRCSGGASVLIGPGCLMYSLVLSYELRPALRIVEQAHRLVLERIACALRPGWPEEIRRQGISDLTRGDRKFSGNSLRCKRTHLLYHGTLLYQFPLALLGQVLRSPPRQPEYRHGRSHAQFVDNLPLEVSRLRDLLVEAWQPAAGPSDWPRDLTETLVRSATSGKSGICGARPLHSMISRSSPDRRPSRFGVRWLGTALDFKLAEWKKESGATSCRTPNRDTSVRYGRLTPAMYFVVHH